MLPNGPHKVRIFPGGATRNCSSVPTAIGDKPGPAGPAGPVAPVAPFAPVAPVAPAAPVAPVSPFGPCAPVAPAAPAAPVAPVSPFLAIRLQLDERSGVGPPAAMF